MGDIVYCNPDAEIEPGSLVVARIEGINLGVCRRYRQTDALDPNGFKLVALNADYPDIEPKPGTQITILGRIVKVLVDI